MRIIERDIFRERERRKFEREKVKERKKERKSERVEYQREREGGDREIKEFETLREGEIK